MAVDVLDAQHPLVAGLPPATDYVTYLMLIEYNLKQKDLELLNRLLQDEQLTVNIGWDLVLLLLPMLPESQPCLSTIARLGNPREVILKVTEALRIIEWQAGEDYESEDESDERANGAAAIMPTDASTTNVEQAQSVSRSQTAGNQFNVLVDMLITLHLRIKTRFPSRFASSSLQAVLAAFNEVPSAADMSSTISSMDRLVRTLSGTRRPALPPRQSTSNIGQLPIETPSAASDPEAQTGNVSDTEKSMQKRLLQSFVTHVVERYPTVCGHDSDEDAPGLMLSGQIFEKSFPQKMIPGRKSWSEKAVSLPEMQECTKVMDSLEQLSRTVGLTNNDLLNAALEKKKPIAETESVEEEPPASPSDIPLSPPGGLFLLAFRQTRSRYGQDSDAHAAVSIFPEQADAIKQVIGAEEAGGMATAGTEPEGIIDAVLALGPMAIHQNEVGEPADDEMFMQYLQIISLISSNSPSPSLRFHAHILTTTVLRSHPSDELLLTFIRDTLEHCPYDNLKVSAVSWIKGETLEANPPEGNSTEAETKSIFASPVALQAVGPFLFPDLTQDFTSARLLESWMEFKLRLSFYLASLNFYYLLLVAQYLHQPLQVASLHEEHDIGGSMIEPLRAASQRYRSSLEEGELVHEEGPHGVEHALLDLNLLDDVLARIEHGVLNLNIHG